MTKNFHHQQQPIYHHSSMDTPDLRPLVDDLATNIGQVEQSLAPLINTALAASTSKLPLLDKAKLYTLVTYAIESLLFSYLRLNGLDAKTHPVFAELTRVKQYFEKIKIAETSHVKRNTTLDKAAAGRFIKHGLAGNDDYDKKRAEQQQEKEKIAGKRKFEDMTERVGSHSRFEAMSRKMNADEAEGSTSAESDDKKKASSISTTAEPVAPRKHKSSKAPRSNKETFQALLQGPLPVEEEPKKKKKRKSKQ
jgi:exosome complex protein LRP1